MKCGTWYVWRQKPAWNSRELRRYLLILRKCCQGSRCCLPSSESRDIGSCWTPNSTHPPNFYTLQQDASDRSSERGQPGHGSLLHAPQHLDTCEMLRNPMLPHSSTDAANMRHAFGVLKWGTLNPWALLKKPSFGWLWYRRKQETSTSLDGWSFNFRRKIWNIPYQVKLSESQMCRGQLQGSLLLKSGCLQVFVWLFVCLFVCFCISINCWAPHMLGTTVNSLLELTNMVQYVLFVVPHFKQRAKYEIGFVVTHCWNHCKPTRAWCDDTNGKGILHYFRLVKPPFLSCEPPNL